MNITLKGIGKKFGSQNWVIKDLDFTFQSNNSYAIVGHNGSGKSTLCKLIAGISLPSRGSLKHLINQQEINHSELYKHLTFASPYLELIESFTLSELIDFHFKFKKLRSGLNKGEFVNSILLEGNEHKPVKDF